jgi:hypothetical protein
MRPARAALALSQPARPSAAAASLPHAVREPARPATNPGSFADRLFDRAEKTGPLRELNFRVLADARSAQHAANPPPAAAEARSAPFPRAGTPAANAAATRFDRAAIADLTGQVIREIRRQERIEREARGIV